MGFFVVFGLCALTDFLDGYLARRYGLRTAHGEVLDSMADFLVIVAVIAVLLPVLPWEEWMIWAIVAICLTRTVSACIGLCRFGQVALLHTLTNKAAGLLLKVAPVMLLFMDSGTVMMMLSTVSMAGALEELLINSFSKELDRNVTSIISVLFRSDRVSVVPTTHRKRTLRFHGNGDVRCVRHGHMMILDPVTFEAAVSHNLPAYGRIAPLSHTCVTLRQHPAYGFSAFYDGITLKSIHHISV
ncbi:MAG: CDP-alcohol phosphatidyltransferase family protein [Candidatus Methanomethylophilaceae archaeon]|nr:CDP-alcohol phosphatidyltransferase family protein [Candidatus Methanomethylophilaceae archaeon]